VTWNEYALAWAGEYGGDPRRAPRLARAWHLAGYHAGRYLAGLGISPITCTVAGIGLAAAVPVAAAGGPVGLLICAVLVISSTVAGCWARALAVLAPPEVRPAIGQAAADRLAEVAWLAGFWVAGVPGVLVVACLGLTGLHDYAKGRAGKGRVAADRGAADRGAADRGTVDRPGTARAAPARPRAGSERSASWPRAWLAVTGLALAGLAGLLGAAGRHAAPGLLTVAAAAWALAALLGFGEREPARRR